MSGEAADCDALIVGAGAAGLTCALALAPWRVVVVSKAQLAADAATQWAQGGIAAAVGPDDACALHVDDTLAVGGGIGVREAAETIVAQGPAAIGQLVQLGACFDRDADGALALGLEAAHSRRRIVRSGGDATGAEVLRTLVAAVQRAPHVRVIEGAVVRELIVHDGSVCGARIDVDGLPASIAARATVLATGGIGGLFARTTNPRGACGDGLALAYRAGAALADLEFVQFHPTALDVALDPLALVSEAVRGEGAVLRDDAGALVTAHLAGGDLAARDLVTRAIARAQQRGRRVSLDARSLVADFPARFPTIFAACMRAGIDPRTQPIPVTPAAHYHMGGVAVDVRGRSTLAGLWACGEVASNGMHGANRLASNSLLEALAGARLAAADIAEWLPDTAQPTPANRLERARSARPAAERAAEGAAFAALRDVLFRHAGPVRDHDGLTAAAALIARSRADRDGTTQLDDALLVAGLIVEAALERTETRGAHVRLDFPAADPEQARRSTIAGRSSELVA